MPAPGVAEANIRICRCPRSLGFRGVPTRSPQRRPAPRRVVSQNGCAAWYSSGVTGSAAALADLTRWLGIAIAVLGALLANPAATQHGASSVGRAAAAAARRTRASLARFVPWLRRDVTVYPRSIDGGLTMVGELSVVARGYVGWGPDATPDEKIEMLSERTKALNKEVADLFALVNKTRDDLSARLTEAVDRAGAEAAGLRAHVDTLQQESVRADATALPLVVVGVVLADLSSDASRFQVWFWVLVLALAVVLAGWSARRVLRTWPGRS